MGLSDWLAIGGLTWLMKKGAESAAENLARQEEETRRTEAKLKAEQEKIRNLQIEHHRVASVNNIRSKMPCKFIDGLSQIEFKKYAHQAGRSIGRIKKLMVYEALVCCTVESQTGSSYWTFEIDFNDWGPFTVCNEKEDNKKGCCLLTFI